MPVLSPVGAEILIAGVTVIWGITVETWFVSRWTIFFNIVPTIAFLAVFDSDAKIVWIMGIFLLISFLVIGISGRQWLKQLVGAKTYGVLALNIGFVNAGVIQQEQFLTTFVMIGLFVALCWGAVYAIKDQYG